MPLVDNSLTGLERKGQLTKQRHWSNTWIKCQPLNFSEGWGLNPEASPPPPPLFGYLYLGPYQATVFASLFFSTGISICEAGVLHLLPILLDHKSKTRTTSWRIDCGIPCFQFFGSSPKNIYEMTSTPPLRIISVQEPPPTPRYGPAHDFQPRYATRSSRRITSRETKTTPEPQSRSRTLRSATTPESKRSNNQILPNNLSPPLSPLKSPKHNQHNPAKRVQVFSPSSPGTRTRSHDTSSNTSFTSSSQQQSFLSNSTVMAEGMLPTPVKTPRKKVVSNVRAAGRALFQEHPNASDEIMPTPKKNRKSKRYNGFSLESIATGDEAGTGVKIFTDSRDNVPELDLSEENPFVDRPSEETASSAKCVTGTSKRRKLIAERKRDPQVDEAIRHDGGMVYVL